MIDDKQKVSSQIVPPNTEKRDIKQILLQESYVSADDMKTAEEAISKTHVALEDYLLSQQLITPALLGQAVAESLHVPYADLSKNAPPAEQIMRIPEDLAKKYTIVVYQEKENGINIASSNPSNMELLAVLKPIFPNKNISFSYADDKSIIANFVHYRKPLDTRFSEIVKTSQKVAPEIIEEIIKDATILRASDIHFEPQEKEVLVRFRIDGILKEAGRIPKEFYENILNRLKVQAYMRIDEHFRPQDGAIRFSTDGAQLDIRVSIVPSLDGEKVVMRLLSEYVKSFNFANLGLSERDNEIITRAAKKPFGMILVTGPTGSGKTTTLYALLKSLNTPEVNITTIEDPVEYRISNITQIQVNIQTGLTFASGLRSIVRQDPNIILVGEIRDLETAEIAVNAALTGHLLFSTFHSNDASTAIPRLIDMGVEPFLLASTLEAVIAQRLVRRICDSCRYSQSMKQEEIAKIFPLAKTYFPKEVTLYKGKGCKVCSNTGFKGRTAIYELIEITSELENLILENPSTQQIWQLAEKQGARSLFEDGIEKVKNGVTTLEELLRITAPPKKTTYGRKK